MGKELKRLKIYWGSQGLLSILLKYGVYLNSCKVQASIFPLDVKSEGGRVQYFWSWWLESEKLARQKLLRYDRDGAAVGQRRVGW